MVLTPAQAALVDAFIDQPVNGQLCNDAVAVPLKAGARANTITVASFQAIALGADFAQDARLVLRCIGTDFCDQIVILQHFSKSTKIRYSCFYST